MERTPAQLENDVLVPAAGMTLPEAIALAEAFPECYVLRQLVEGWFYYSLMHNGLPAFTWWFYSDSDAVQFERNRVIVLDQFYLSRLQREACEWFRAHAKLPNVTRQ